MQNKPLTIKTDERIFQILTYDGDVILCNLVDAYNLLPDAKAVKYYWNNKFESFAKADLKKMYETK